MSAALTEFVYCLPGDEDMCVDPSLVYKAWEWDNGERVPFVIEKWTAVPLGFFVPSPDHFLARIADDLYQSGVSEGAGDHITDAVADDEVRAAFDVAFDVLRARLNRIGWQASKKVGDLQVTWDDNGKPLLDGEPMYVPREADPDGQNGDAG